MMEQTINWVWVGVITILVICGWKGKRAGLIKSVFSMLSVVAALTGAVFIGPMVRVILSDSKAVMEYLGSGMDEKIAAVILNALSFILAYIIISIALAVVCGVLDIVAKLPVLHQINETAGLLVGLAEGLLDIWIGFVVLNIFCETSWGKVLLESINNSSFLTMLYENNLLYAIWDIL